MSEGSSDLRVGRFKVDYLIEEIRTYRCWGVRADRVIVVGDRMILGRSV